MASRSSQIRRRIGIVRKQLTLAISTCIDGIRDNLPDYLHKASDEELLEHAELQQSNHESLLTQLTKLDDLNKEWTELMNQNQDEVTIFHEYIAKYGDYRADTQNAIETLQRIDNNDVLIQEELQKRGLIPAFDAYPVHQTDTNPHDNRMKQYPPPTTQPVSHIPVEILPPNYSNTISPSLPHRPADNVYLNYFDASLLTRLELPSFSGNLIEFPEFWARYQTLIHSKTTLSGATKFSLLKSCLKGRALQTLDGLPVTDENYITAIDILKSTYDNPSILRHLLYTQLSNIPQCDADGKQLQEIYLRMLRLVRQYTAITPDSPEFGLGALLYNKLPRFVKSRIYDMNHGQKNLMPSELMSLLGEIVKKESMLRQIDSSASHHLSYHTTHNRGQHQNTTYPSLRGGNDSTMEPRQYLLRQCPFCRRTSHNAFQCRTVQTPKERRDFAKSAKMCFKCLKQGHQTITCTRPPCYKCKYHHHPALCYKTTSSRSHLVAQGRQRHPQNEATPRQHYQPRSTVQHRPTPSTPPNSHHHKSSANISQPLSSRQVNFSSNEEEAKPNEETEKTANSIVSSVNLSTVNHQHDSSNNSILLMCTKVILVNPNDDSIKIETVAFLDSGSSHSYLTKDIATQLKLDYTQPEEISLHTFGSSDATRTLSHLHTIHLILEDDTHYPMTVQSLPFLTQALKLASAPQQHISVNEEDIALPTTSAQPGLLIGIDHFWNLILSPAFYSRMLPSGYHLLNTRLGKVISGRKFTTRTINTAVIDNDYHPFNKSFLEEMVEKFWKCESLGSEEEATRSDDSTCLEFFNNTTRYDEDEQRYYTRLPFKMDRSSLPENFDHSVACLRSNWKALAKKPEYLDKYNDIIQEQLRRRIIEEAPHPDTTKNGTFLSHHAVIKESKKLTKIRLVYNGSARVHSAPSLNDCLHRGPVLLPDLSGILMRIRFAPILLISDIEKAYLMVGLEEGDRPFTKFLWLKNHRNPPTMDNLVVYHFRRVPFGLICSPFLLAATIHLHLTRTGTALAQEILESCYVDNIFLAASSANEAIQKYMDTKNLFSLAGMNVREWVSSSSTVNETLQSSEETTIEENVKLLGLTWNIPTDTISIRLPFLQEEMRHPTKRSVLKIIASIYDPLGFIAPITVTAKIFLQSLWKDKLQWDEHLSEKKQKTWNNITSTWTQPHLKFPRSIVPSEFQGTSFQLHIFTDASSHAYCAIAYLRIETSDRVEVKFLMARTRLSPLHSTITIPRLELSALTLGSTLMKHLTRELKTAIEQRYIWSDSSVALQWARTSSNLPVFVQNRVKRIRENAPEAKLRHVPTTLNPADLGSRGATIHELNCNEQWWKGPVFLRNKPGDWPEDKSDTQTSLAVINSSPDTEEVPSSPCIIDVISNRNTWISVLRIMIAIITFISNIRISVARRKGVTERRPNYSQTATAALFRQAQLINPISPEQKTNLRAYYDSELHLWRSRGRIQNSSLPFDTNNPIILPRRTWITSLYILHHHLKNNHIGVSQTLTVLRQLVWIPQGRTEVRRVINKSCFYCRKEKAKPFILPSFPDYPPERVTQPPYPFYNSAVDYLGPFTIRDSQDMHSKIWIALFTCLNTRAIYVDIASSLSASCFLHILRRFIASNGNPKWLLSDNAPSFVAVSETMPSASTGRHQEIIDYCSTQNIQFKFITALAPWQGGIYERMIGIFKTSLTAAVKHRILGRDEFLTLTKECEAIVNSRPLTYVYSDIDSGYPLRPIDFLRPHSLIGSPRLSNEQEDDDEWKPVETQKDILHKQWHSTMTLLNHFWQRWNEEYLTSLRENYQDVHKHPHRISPEHPFQDQIVLIHDAVRPRGQWKLGRIVRHSDKSAQVKLPNGNEISRPLNLLYPLEIPPQQPQDQPAPTNRPSPSQNDTNSGPRNHSQRSRTHPMTTRSMAHQALLSVLMIILVSSATATKALAPDTKCNGHQISSKRVIYTDQCSDSGIAIATTTSISSSTRSFCWFHITCPTGHIKSPPFQPNTGFCGDKCSCPSWTNTCSHYKGRLTSLSTIRALPSAILHFLPHKVCSFEPSARCSSEKRLGVFYQIQLYDGTLLIVPELHIQTLELFSQDDFYCYDFEGNEVSSQSSLTATGTSAFCRRHPCSSTKEADIFCTYHTPITIYRRGNHSIIAKAWGTITREYYPSKTSPPHNVIPAYVIPRCIKGGILIETTENFDMIETCSSFVCIYISNYSSTSHILLPTSIVTFRYTVKIRAWKNGTQKFSATKECEGRPICEIIECSMCLEHIFNPQCWTTMELIVTISACLITLLACRLASPALKCLLWFLKKLIRISRICVTSGIRIITRRKRGSYTIPNFPSYQRPHLRRIRRTIPSLLLFCIIEITKQCSDVVSLSGISQYCRINSTGEECLFDNSVLIHLQPIGQDACLLLRNTENFIAGTISVRVNDIAYACNQKTEYFTRDHKFYTESHHQCWNTLSCKGETCQGTHATTNIKEFSKYAKENPGFTYCTPSCKCLWCDWCFFCKETCLFYKVYAWPQSDTVYRVFSCPTWSITVTGRVTLETTRTKEHHDFILQPARPHTWNHLELTLTTTIVPNLPVLSTYFLTDEITFAAVEPSPPGFLLPNSVGQLQCGTSLSAKAFSSCKFSPSTCTCTSHVYEATCSCPEGNIRKYLDHPQHRLPLLGKNIVILRNDGNIHAKAGTGSSISVQLSVHELSLFTRRVQNECTLTAGSLTGCYSCLQGAHVQVSCASSLTEETAEIVCGNQTQLAPCSPHGTISNLIFHFTSSVIQINCSVKCPASQSQVQLQGILDYVNEPLIQTMIQEVHAHRAESSGFVISDIIGDILSPFRYLSEIITNWKTIVIVLLLTVILFKLLKILRSRTISATFVKKRR